jgi:integral membrane sensor domain MASE1
MDVMDDDGRGRRGFLFLILFYAYLPFSYITFIDMVDVMGAVRFSGWAGGLLRALVALLP